MDHCGVDTLELISVEKSSKMHKIPRSQLSFVLITFYHRYGTYNISFDGVIIYYGFCWSTSIPLNC